VVNLARILKQLVDIGERGIRVAKHPQSF
jgi:hypothetical protein